MADFFDKVKDGFNKGVATVSTGSKNMIEKSKINSCIKTFENEKKQIAEIIGTKIYNFCYENAEGDIPRDLVISLCGEITNRNEQIMQQKKRLAELEAEMNQVMGTSVNNFGSTCACGYTNAPGARFCAKCGNKLNV